MAKRNFEKSIPSNIKKDAKSFYACVQSKSHVKESVGPLKDDTDLQKRQQSNPSNYRPISLTVILCKIFESILRDKIVEHLEKHELIRESQHGFVKKTSCLSNLLVFMEEVTNYLDSEYPVDVIYLDFQ